MAQRFHNGAMSLDLEDFEFAVVDRFPHAFGRKKTVAPTTPAELVDHIVAELPPPSDRRSVKQHAFYRVRALLARQLGRPLRFIHPDTSLAELMPDAQRRRAEWAAIRAALKVPTVHGLARPEAVLWTIVTASGGAFLAGVSVVARYGPLWLIIPTGAAAASLVFAGLFRATRRLAVHLAWVPATVGDLASFVTAYGSPLLDPALIPRTRGQVREVVRELLRLEAGARPVDLDQQWERLVETDVVNSREDR
jgi:hypothetical protein